MKLQTLTANMKASSIRIATLNGRDHYVVRMSMLVPGVLPGSKGPLLYPEEEVTSNPESWNGMPIVLEHPTKDGVGRSARSPEVIENQGLGFVFNSTNKRRKLDADAWIDIEKTQRLAPSVIEDLKAGRPVEISTGLFTDNYRKQGVHNNGQAYIGIARNYRPDHLAILVGKKGACSIKDGCGLLMNAKHVCTCQTLNADPSFDESKIKRADDGKFGSGGAAPPEKKGSAAMADEAIARGFKKEKATKKKAAGKGGVAGKLADDGTKKLKAKGGGGGSAGAAKVIDALGKANPNLKTLTVQGPEGQYQVPNPSYKPKPTNNVLRLKRLLLNFNPSQPRDGHGRFGSGGGGSSGGGKGKATKKAAAGGGGGSVPTGDDLKAAVDASLKKVPRLANSHVSLANDIAGDKELSHKQHLDLRKEVKSVLESKKSADPVAAVKSAVSGTKPGSYAEKSTAIQAELQKLYNKKNVTEKDRKRVLELQQEKVKLNASAPGNAVGKVKADVASAAKAGAMSSMQLVKKDEAGYSLFKPSKPTTVADLGKDLETQGYKKMTHGALGQKLSSSANIYKKDAGPYHTETMDITAEGSNVKWLKKHIRRED